MCLFPRIRETNADCPGIAPGQTGFVFRHTSRLLKTAREEAILLDMEPMSREEKLEIMNSINWDYLDTPEDMLAVAEGRLETSGAFTRDKLFVRSLERLAWSRITGLWGLEAVKKLYTPELARRIWPKDLRQRYDFAIAILRREIVPIARWGDEYYRQMWHPVFSNRRYGA
jgi:hypothetical protein